MKKIQIKIKMLILLVLLFASCTNDVAAPDITWETIFLQYWNTMNTEYVHFSDDSAFDWDKVYEDYLGKFQALDYSSQKDSFKAFKYFQEIAVNVFDYHYGLVVTDGFGNTLNCSPALLQKYKKNNPDADINDFPDLIIGGTTVASINNPTKAYKKAEVLEYYKKAIPSIYEVEDLEENHAFHVKSKGEDAVTNEYGKCYYGDSISSFKDADIEKITDEDEQLLALTWNSLLKTMEITSAVNYFYGVNSDNVFYMQFSGFSGTLFLLDILTKDESALTEEEKDELEKEPKIKEYREMFQKFNGTKYESIQEKFNSIRGLTEMYNALKSVTADNKCTVNGVEKTDIKGVIVDIRCNGGGEVSFLSSIWGTFLSEETQMGYVRYKSGYSRLEYTPWVSFSIEDEYTNEGLTSNYTKPVAVLVNGYSVSCSEISCIVAKQLPNCRIVGEQTFGGTCGLTDRKIYNGGPFSSDHISIYTTTYQFEDTSGKSFETVGITPDIETELSKTTDNAYIKAVEWINGESTK